MTGSYLPLGASSGYLRLGANAKKLTPEQREAEAPGTSASNPSVDATLTSGEVARKSGFTGDQCDHCGSMMMVQTGHCKTCQSCFTTTGCS